MDTESAVLATSYALNQKAQLPKEALQQAIKDFNLDPEKPYPQFV